ncbi:uncharacterized protein LOC131943269 [Physella acuta]|uniref:uncharacterized protein LOC131943269 n=1 Tax=Physella acuta TaxID=109671 RepID=UPI0027DC3F6A|nr:uncharacterized protein LOC131943269 [Physella acuta]
MSSGVYDGPFIGDGETNPTNWRKGKMFAQGGFGKVYHVDKGPLKNTKCVVKQVVVSSDYDDETLKMFDAETRALKIVKHKRVVNYYGFSRTDIMFSLFMEFMEKDTLANHIKTQRKKRLSEEKTAMFSYQILEGLVYLHEQKIIHRDIKGSNILMQDENTIKITDFGVAKILNTISSASTSTSQKGTIFFMAPEAIHENVAYNDKVDIWSLGCTVYQMITGNIPFKDFSRNAIIARTLQNAHELPIPEDSSVNLKMFLKQTCEKDPSKRPTAKEAIHHPFLKDFVLKQTSVMNDGAPLDAEERDDTSIGSVNQISTIGLQQPDINKTCGLPRRFEIFVGAKVMLRSNIDVSKGLVNGAIGYITDIIWPHFRRAQIYDTDIPSVRIDFGKDGVHEVKPKSVQFSAKYNYSL